jgi:starvation-inducible DNA-binding protein
MPNKIKMMDNLNIYADKLVKALNNATIVSRMAHWNVRGSNFYEAHLLFERIYNDLGEHMDGLIETFRAFGYNADFEQFSGPGITMHNYDCHYLGNLILDYLLTLSSALALCFQQCDESAGDPRIIGLSNHIQNISDEILSDMYLLQSYLGV